MSVNQSTTSHPKGLYILFATEMWERFNYYGMRAVLVLFMTKALLFDKAFASSLYGSYTSLVYLTPLVGGFIADRYWGNQRSIIAGGLLMALGELLLFFCGGTYATAPGISPLFFFSGLGLMIAGNGLFKPNISTLVGQLYTKGDRRVDSAYTIFYMGINVGGALGPFICGLVGDTGNAADFKWAFLAGAIGMLIGVAVQLAFAKKYIISPDNKRLGQPPVGAHASWSKPLFVVLGLAAFAALAIGLLYVDAKVFVFLPYLLLIATLFITGIILSDKSLNKVEKQRVSVIFIVAFFVIFFWSAFEQAGASLTFFADEQTNRHLGLNLPIWIIYPLGVIALFFVVKLIKATKISMGGKQDAQLRNLVYALLSAFAIGVVCVIASITFGGKQYLTLNELPASTFQSLNSVFVVSFAPLFAWLWLKLGKYEPAAPTKMAIGLFLLSLGYLWIAFGVKDVAPGIKVSMIWLLGMYALHTWGELCLSPIGLSLVNKMSPIKFGSLLMAVWFLANSFANYLAGTLSSLYPDKNPTSFLGYTMTNLYDFFILFVVMSGIASLILFVLSKWLQKLMNGVK
jgi:proton-dependent oligopeptide transporter, POT family